jgi:MPBQ/MSBQ methyltransferase
MRGSAAFAARYDATINEPRMRALYGDSGYFNVGYWVDGVRDLPSACDRLVDEVASAIGAGASSIIDAGCGLGAGTRRIASRNPGAHVTAINLSVWQLSEAGRRGVTARVAADATSLPCRSASADAIVAIESAEHFDPREQFFSEAWRVLRSGGVLALSDMIFHDGDAISEQMMLPHRRARSIDEYRSALVDAGFSDVTVRDITADSWTPYCAEMQRVFTGQEAALRSIERALAHYVVAVAHRS